MLQDRGLLVESEGGWTLTGEAEDLPESIQGIIAARLDTLTDEEKTFIQDASVIGKTAWIGAVCALTERSTWEADELLHSLERKQLLQRVRHSSIDGEAEFNFTHALTRDVAYSQIRRADRAQKHEAAAEWIERLAGERDDKAELLADHYHQALDAAPGARRGHRRARAQGPRRVHRSRPPSPGPSTPTQRPRATTAPPLHSPRAIDVKQRAALLLGEANAQLPSRQRRGTAATSGCRRAGLGRGLGGGCDGGANVVILVREPRGAGRRVEGAPRPRSRICRANPSERRDLSDRRCPSLQPLGIWTG